MSGIRMTAATGAPYWQLPGGAGTGMVNGGPKRPGGGGGLTHCTTTREAVPGAPRLMARQYAPSS